ncbi:nucleotide exchange factor GrpE [Candidatus Uhrbacteria bacterium]|nr:nucleotide exchange factor GrpE [Candidatus Uhrbacteria bacterium]
MEENVTLEQVQAQCEEYLAGWKRAQADYANLKKETEREKHEFAKYANERLLSELLPAVDQYDLALSHTPDVSQLPEEDQKKLKNWIIGVHAVRSLWETAFQSIGLELVPTEGPFDPAIHEAVGEEENAEHSEGHIVRVSQPGWTLNGKLLRPAKVIISKQ